MQVKKYKNGNIDLKLQDEQNEYDVLLSDDLMRADLSVFTSSEDGWMYCYDANQDKLYSMNDYGYNNIQKLLEGKIVKLIPMEDCEETRELIESQYN